MIILLFFNDTKKIVIHENTDHIFDKDITNILLEPYEETEGIKYTYDDISTIIINYYRGEPINTLPNGLKKIEKNRNK